MCVSACLLFRISVAIQVARHWTIVFVPGINVSPVAWKNDCWTRAVRFQSDACCSLISQVAKLCISEKCLFVKFFSAAPSFCWYFLTRTSRNQKKLISRKVAKALSFSLPLFPFAALHLCVRHFLAQWARIPLIRQWMNRERDPPSNDGSLCGYSGASSSDVSRQNVRTCAGMC